MTGIPALLTIDDIRRFLMRNRPGNWKEYTMRWTGSVGDPDIGNGTLSAYYSQWGPWVMASCKITIGSTTSIGSGTYSFYLPTTCASEALVMGQSMLKDDSVSTFYPGIALVDQGSSRTFVQLHTSGGLGAAIAHDTPIGITTGDQIYWSIIYPNQG